MNMKLKRVIDLTRPNGREDSRSNKKSKIRRKIRKAALPVLRIKQSSQERKNAQ